MTTEQPRIENIPVQLLSYVADRLSLPRIPELAESIKKYGLLNPIRVEIAGQGKYRIRRGRRRFEACKLAGMTSIPSFVVSCKAEDDLLDMIENTQREPYTPVELYEKIKAGVKGGDVHKLPPDALKELALRMNLSLEETMRVIRVGELAADVRALVADRKLPLGVALLTLRLPDAKMRTAFVKWALAARPSARAAADYITDDLDRENQGPTRDLHGGCLFDTEACAGCRSRGGNDPSLFENPDTGKNSDAKRYCWNPACFDKKTNDVWAVAGVAAVKLGLKAEKPSGRVETYEYTQFDGAKKKDHSKCTGCARCILADKYRLPGTGGEHKIVIACPKTCSNIAGVSRESGSGRGKASKPVSDKPVIERTRAEKISYLNEKLAPACRKFMVSHLLDGHQGSWRLKPTHIPADHLRVLFYLGADNNENPFSSGYTGGANRKIPAEIIKARDLKALAHCPGNLERVAVFLSNLDRSPVDHVDIEKNIESLYGEKGYCSHHYREIVEKLQKTAKAVLQSIQPWTPAWAPYGASGALIPATPAGGKCRICGCTDSAPCVSRSTGATCAWTDRTKTLCTNPRCIAAAKKALATFGAKKAVKK